MIAHFNPSVTTCHLPYMANATPRNATGHGKGRRLNTNDFLSLSKKVLVTLIRFICSFFSAARRTNQEAPPQLSGFWLVATVAVGVCGTRFARTVLALFPPSSLRLHRPIKAGIFSRAFDSLSNPSLTACHLPYILLCKTPRKATGHGRGNGLNTL